MCGNSVVTNGLKLYFYITLVALSSTDFGTSLILAVAYSPLSVLF